MRQVRHIMGMPISIDIPGCEDTPVFKKAFGRLSAIDRRFSTYKSTSEVSRFSEAYPQKSLVPRSLLGNRWSGEFREVFEACREAEKMTDGYFSAWAGGKFDPSGYVKGWAIAEAGQVIEKQGYKTYCIGAGGDILARSDSDKVWNIGIQDPKDTMKILDTSSISNGAVCTSGSYERGAHIINPKTIKPATKFLSVTITGPGVITADILATAVFASGIERPEFIKNYPSYRSLVIKA